MSGRLNLTHCERPFASQPKSRGSREGADRHGIEVNLIHVPLLSEPLRDGVMVELAHKDFNRLFGVPSNTKHNPCSKPVSISPEDFERLKAEAVVAADKSDGVRYQLLLGRWPDLYGGQPYSLMVDEKCRFYEVLVVASQDFFKGTLLDGELVDPTDAVVLRNGPEYGEDAEGRRRLVFLAFDALAMAGERVAHLDMHKRRGAAAECLGSDGDFAAAMTALRAPGETEAAWRSARTLSALRESKIVCAEEGLAFSVKTSMVPLRMMTDERSDPSRNRSYPTDGLILTFVYEGYRFGRNHAMLKVKYDHTIDLRVVCDAVCDQRFGDGGSSYASEPSFYFQDDGMEVPARLTAPNGNPVHFALEPNSPGVPPGTADIWECRARIDGYAVYLCPFLRRDGKPEPNDRATVERTLRSIANPILPEHLYRLFDAPVGSYHYGQPQSYLAYDVDPARFAQDAAAYRAELALADVPENHPYRDMLY